MHPNMSTYKPDWAEARERLSAWWAGEKTDRVPAYVTAPLKPAKPRAASRSNSVPEKYTDPATVLNNAEYAIERCFWGGESFPCHRVYFGPLFCLAYLGCRPNFAPDTTWYEPCLRDWTELPEVKFDPANRWWQLSIEMARFSVDRAQNRWMVTLPMTIAALMDTICGLLGNEKTLMAMAERPEAVKAALARMMPLARQTYDEAHGILRHHQEGSVDWMHIWAPGRVISNQCDMSVMISPEMFRDFVAPELTDLYNHVDYGIYHMDGPGQIRHLDELLKIDKLHLIQWQPGTKMNDPDHRDPMKWIDLFRRIQEGGKKVLVSCPPERVRPLLDKIARDCVLLQIGCKDEQAARNALRELESIGV